MKQEVLSCETEVLSVETVSHRMGPLRSLAVAGACVHVCACVWKNTEKPKEQPEQCVVFVFVEKSHKTEKCDTPKMSTKQEQNVMWCGVM